MHILQYYDNGKSNLEGFILRAREFKMIKEGMIRVY